MKKGIYLLLFLLIAACEKPIVVDLPDHESQLVAYGFFAPDSTWKIHLSNSVSYTDRLGPQLITDGQIALLRGSEVIGQFQHVSDGFYVLPDGQRPVNGELYTIRARADGYLEVTGDSEVPTPVTVSAPQVSVTANTTIPDLEDWDVTLTVPDPGNEENFYGIRARVNWRITYMGEVVSEEGFYTSIRTRDPVLLENDGAILDAEAIYLDDANFSDDLFQGRSQQVNFTLETPVNLVDFAGENGEEADVEIWHEIEFLTMTRDMYRYWVTRNLQELTSEDPFAEPVQIHSNMSNGYGVFAGYNVQRIIVTRP